MVSGRLEPFSLWAFDGLGLLIDGGWARRSGGLPSCLVVVSDRALPTSREFFPRPFMGGAL